jgi:carbamoyl-phosphate synthase large subunit
MEIEEKLREPTDERLFIIAEAIRRGMMVEEIHNISKIDPWFLVKIERLVQMEQRLRGLSLDAIDHGLMLSAKKLGFNDRHIGELTGASSTEVRALRKRLGIAPVYKMVDTCAGEFEAQTPYYYSCYESESE